MQQRMWAPNLCALLPAFCFLIALMSTPTVQACAHWKNTTRNFLQSVIWPQTLNAVFSGSLPPVFDPSVQGQVVPVGRFATAFGALEYFYALAGPLDPSDPVTIRVTSSKIEYIACDPQPRLVHFKVAFQFGTATAPVTVLYLQGWFKFNNKNLVCSYDLNIPRLGLIFDDSFKGGAGALAQTIQGICYAEQTFCLGPNKQYPSFQDCVQTLSSIPPGSFDNADQNSIACRAIHAKLIPARPQVHCMHVGADGGGVCTDKTYSQWQGYQNLFSVC